MYLEDIEDMFHYLMIWKIFRLTISQTNWSLTYKHRNVMQPYVVYVASDLTSVHCFFVFSLSCSSCPRDCICKHMSVVKCHQVDCLVNVFETLCTNGPHTDKSIK